MSPLFMRGAVGAAVAALASAAFAQRADTLPEVTVTGNPLGSAQPVAPVASTSGRGLLLRQRASVGDTLDGLPGVSTTWFGPAASRPVIRGLDGDRIRMLHNGGSALDLSGLSYDHAVAADPISLERIEVLRGPAALLYGGNATGGVVNMIDNRIPREPMAGVAGRVDAGFATGSRERSAAAMVEGGNERAALHVDVFGRRAGEVRVPADLACTQAGVTRVARRICNSGLESSGGAVGGSLFFDRGYLGASIADHHSDYGSVAEDEVRVDMRSRRTALEGELRDLAGPLRQVKAQWSHTDYRHVESDAGVPGTEFTSRGHALRIEARHAPLGPLRGVIGLQAEHTRFGAVGDEAFAPPSRTRERAVFLLEELAQPWGTLTAGMRLEHVRVSTPGDVSVGRFTAGERSFTPASASLGALWKLAPGWELTGTLAHTERAPRDYELFANGPHVATAAYEVGDRTLRKESSATLDAGLRWTQGAHRAQLNVFTTRFSNYIALLATGAQQDVDGELLPELAYSGVRARMRGLEASGSVPFIEGASPLALEWRADHVRATNASTGQPLPRIAPWRVGGTLVWSQGPWGARLGVDHHARQSRVPVGERTTPGFTLWHAALTWRMKAGPATLDWYARLDNASNRFAESATSILTQTAPGRVPLPGRSLKVGVQALF